MRTNTATKKNKEEFLLKVNDIFGLPAGVHNALFRSAMDIIGNDLYPLDFYSWARGELVKYGYRECPSHNGTYQKLGEMQYKFLGER